MFSVVAMSICQGNSNVKIQGDSSRVLVDRAARASVFERGANREFWFSDIAVSYSSGGSSTRGECQWFSCCTLPR